MNERIKNGIETAWQDQKDLWSVLAIEGLSGVIKSFGQSAKTSEKQAELLLKRPTQESGKRLVEAARQEGYYDDLVAA